MPIAMRRVVLSIAIATACWATPATSEAKHWTQSFEGGLPRVLEYNEEGRPIAILEDLMMYRYFLPQDYDPSIKYPLVLFMHGSGDEGRNNTSQVSHYLEDLIDQTDSNYPAILVAPQLPRSSGWSPEQQFDRTDEILDIMLSDFSIDTNRLYVTGLSLGGFGTMSYLQYYNAYAPETLRFAAGAPVAGSWIDPSAVDALQDTPIWLAHSASDGIVSPDASRDTFNILSGNEVDTPIVFDQTGADGPMAEFENFRYTEYPTGGHFIWGRFYESPDFYEWMFSQSLVPEPSSLAIVLVGMTLATSRRWR